MRIFSVCKSCKTQLSLFISEETRAEYSMNNGDFKNLNCKNCGSNSKIHINDFIAKRSYLAEILGLIIFLVGTCSLLFFSVELFEKGYIYLDFGLLLLPIAIFIVIKQNGETRVRSFNSCSLYRKE